MLIALASLLGEFCSEFSKFTFDAVSGCVGWKEQKVIIDRQNNKLALRLHEGYGYLVVFGNGIKGYLILTVLMLLNVYRNFQCICYVYKESKALYSSFMHIHV